ncbi:MAG TPA: hypothetical protein VJU59_39235 [Paraburkholderia sp.]|uniref:hypothetical protein n=1 Tax=Paraburkholderia sp. TaxID=1926495 RepID=UPI002B46DE0F|nr:hypothetical protein [Paraburkholderia sp.]HKR45636.1 hypothetical protein [Paraburkholderia sp.]
MDRLMHAWTIFMTWPPIARRAAIAVLLYLLWLFSVWIYSEGLHDTAVFLGTLSSAGFIYAIGGWYVVCGVFSLLFRCRRIFR